MAKCLLVLVIFCVVATSGFADSWTPPEPIPSSFSAYRDVFTTYDPNTNQYMATWADSSNQNPMYAIYDVQTKSWSLPQPISTSVLVYWDVFTSCDPANGFFMATWEEDNSPDYSPMYSTFTIGGSGWSSPQPFPGGTGVTGLNLFTTFDPINSQFIAIWGNFANSDKIVYSIYGISGWSSPSLITGSPQAYNDVFITLGSGQFMATWADDGTKDPKYAIYTTALGWSSPGTIPGISTVYNDVTTSFDPTNGQFMATWADRTSNYPTYAIYTAGPDWSSSAAISSASTADYDVFTSFDSSKGQFMATWSDATQSSPLTPAYSLYTVNTGEWSSPAVISATATTSSSDVPNSFGSVNGQFMATWSDQITFSLYPAQFSPPAPTGFAGKQRKNDFAIVSERYNVLSWQKALGVTYYELFRNGELIATLGGDADSYEDHDQPKHNVTYSLVAFNASGGSNPAMVTVGSK